MRLTPLAVAAAVLVFPSVGLHAQSGWSAGVELGESRFSGTSADTSAGSDGGFRPFRPTTVTARLEHGGRRLQVGLAITFASAPAAIEGPAALIVARTDPLKLLELAPVVSWRVVQVGKSAALWVSGGPIVDRWTWSLGETRFRAGAAAGLALDMRLASGVGAIVRAGLALTGSVFENADLPPEFERRDSWRRSVALGVRVGR